MRKRIYIIRTKTTNFYKIGVAKNPFERIDNLQIGCPEELVYIIDCPEWPDIQIDFKGLRHREKEFHKALEKYWVRGEWFADSPELQNLINKLVDRKVNRVKSTFQQEYEQFVREQNWEARQAIADWRKSYYCA